GAVTQTDRRAGLAQALSPGAGAASGRSDRTERLPCLKHACARGAPRQEGAHTINHNGADAGEKESIGPYATSVAAEVRRSSRTRADHLISRDLGARRRRNVPRGHLCVRCQSRPAGEIADFLRVVHVELDVIDAAVRIADLVETAAIKCPPPYRGAAFI